MSAKPAIAALLFALLFSFTVAHGEDAAPAAPDRRELWVPFDKLGHVLDANAVLLSHEQYDALLRDAGRERNPKIEAPVAAVISSADFRAVPEGKTAIIHAELRVNVLRDGWCEVPLDFPGAAVGEVKLDGDGVLAPANAAMRADPDAEKAGKAVVKRPAMLLVRGRGEHRVAFEITAVIQSAGGVNTFALGVPGVASGAFTLALPAGATMEKCDAAMRVARTAEATTATVALSPARDSVAFAWKAGAENDSKIPVRAQAFVRYDIDAEKISGTQRIHLEAPLGDLPTVFEFAVPAGVKVLSVRAEELRGWDAADGKITAEFQDGARREIDLEIGVELQPVIGKDAVPTVLPMPVLRGASRLDGVLHIAGADNVTIKDVSADARMRRMPTADDRGERGFFGAYEFSGSGVSPRVVIERAEPTMESDLDTLVEFRADAIFITRTITLREQKGRRFSTSITLPAAEEFLSVRSVSELAVEKQGIPGLPNAREANQESEPEWMRDGARIALKWSDEAAKSRMFRVRSRIEPEKWTQLPAEGISLALGDAKIADSAKVTGYIALTADAAFRIEARAGETLERRDGRSTPVRGEYAWFRRDEFDLTIQIARRPSEVLAALTGYALPLEGLLDLHAVMNYQFAGGGTRAVRLRVPKDLAQNFHFEGPQIAERTLADDVWTVTFQKELTGAYALGITAQIPVEKMKGRSTAGDGSEAARGYSFEVRVPVISPLDVVRASGLWAVEANTETEITFDARGMNELDSLLAPQLADYAPRHRVIGVFGWLGADYALMLHGVRHAPAGMLAAIVDALELNTVVSTSGTHRHEAIYRLRASGVEYFDVALPQGAALLSTVIDGAAVKPVADRPGNVRLQLPAKRDANTEVVASLVYETSGGAWKNRGRLALAAPSLVAGIPVLKSTWRVWVPEGFSFSDIESNLPVPDAPREELLVASITEKIGDFALGGFLRSRKRSQATQVLEDLRIVDEPVDQLSTKAAARSAKPDNTGSIVRKLNNIRFPQVEFRDASVRDVVDILNRRSREMDAEKQGVSIIMDGVAESADMPRITLALSNVPLVEVIKYVTNLANLNFKVEPNRVRIVPIGTLTDELFIKRWKVPPSLFRAAPDAKTPNAGAAGTGGTSNARDFLASSGVTFGQGSLALYSAASNTLIVKGTQDQLDLVERIIAAAGGSAEGAPTPKPASRLLSSSAPNTTALNRKLERIIFPKIDFRDATVREAIEFLSAKSKSFDPDGQGVNIVLRLGDEGGAGAPAPIAPPPAPGISGLDNAAWGGSGTRITLTLNNVPLIEVIKYVTNLANLKYKIEPFAVYIVPISTATEELFIKQWQVPRSVMGSLGGGNTGGMNAKAALEASGVTFGQGAFAMYGAVSQTLIVKNTQDQIDLIERLIETAGGDAEPVAGFGRTAGLLPVMLDLPKSGPALVFDGLFAPERVVMRYDDWRSRARALWMWFVAGGILFWLLASRRPWWQTLWAVLVLSALPLCAFAAWTPVCNAVLGGWLAGLVLNRVGAWCVFRVKKEVLA
jgi:hypothetical protein